MHINNDHLQKLTLTRFFCDTEKGKNGILMLTF